MSSTDSTELDGFIFELIRAGTFGRDFYYAMYLKFEHVPEVAKVWQSMLFDELADLDRLRSIYSTIRPGGSPWSSLARPSHPSPRVSDGLTDDRIHSVRTLKDAFEIACEYERTGIHAAVDTVVSQFLPKYDKEGVQIRPRLRDPDCCTALLSWLLGDSEQYSNIPAAAGRD